MRGAFLNRLGVEGKDALAHRAHRRGRIGCVKETGDEDDAARARGEDRLQVVEFDAADAKNRERDQLVHAPDFREADWCVVGFGRRRPERAEAQVIRAFLHRRDRLGDAVRGFADDDFGADEAAHFGDRWVVLADVNAVTHGERGMVVDDQRNAGRLGERPQLRRESRDFGAGNFFGAELQHLDAARNQSARHRHLLSRGDGTEIENSVNPRRRQLLPHDSAKSRRTAEPCATARLPVKRAGAALAVPRKSAQRARVIRWLLLFLCATGAVSAADLDPAVRQLIVSVAPTWDSSTGKLILLERKPGGDWTAASPIFPVLYGKNGLAWGRGLRGQDETGRHKEERDGRAPAGLFKIGTIYTYDEALPTGAKYPFHTVTTADAWIDDPANPLYNQHVAIDPANPPPWFEKEKMRHNDFAYRWLVEIRHNADLPVSGAGSAIFFHIRRGAARPTSGCTTMAEENLVSLIRWLRAEAHPHYLLLPAAEYERKRAAWGLPDLQPFGL